HRELIYDERRKILSGADLKSNILGMVKEEIKRSCGAHLAGYEPDYDGVAADIVAIFPLPPDVTAESLGKMSSKEIEEKLIDLAESLYEAREKEIGAENMRILERLVMLRIIDSLWIEHLTMMEHMRLEAGWQTLRQTRAVDAYKNEGYKQFQLLLSTIRHDVALAIYHVSIVRKEASAPAPSPMVRAVAPRPSVRQPVKSAKKVGRNEPCPCGSGKKYKHCHGR
ncbi:MAG: SEC-C metal-binding domain-containing protein, partial [Chloroflexota bacterium]